MRKQQQMDGFISELSGACMAYLKLAPLGMITLKRDGIPRDIIKARLSLASGSTKHESSNLFSIWWFDIKYIKEANLDHLILSQKKHYDVIVNKEGQEYMKIELDWH